MSKKPFVPVDGQAFYSEQDWINRATRQLTAHPLYKDTEHGGEGWRGHHFKAMCFDQRGRRCRIGSDFMRAEREQAYPIWWIWPDQIVELLMAANSQSPDEEPQRSEGDTALQQAQQKSDTNNTVEDPESDSVEFEKLMP